ncbi:MAG: asparagine synthase (glutamine-hydrolyzing) [Deltaproteobacteria bacterium]
MCGIVGIWSPNNKINREVLISMTNTLSHRGPDDSGIYIDEEYSLGLGHRRLSVLDQSPLGHQPMANDNESIWVTYNGEIFNFKDIRKELIQKGYKFKSNTDTEVIVKSFEEWGIECVNKFIGMFAIGIWDSRVKKLYLIRDRAGVKPLYYYFKDGLLLFGSELKALMKYPKFNKDIDLNALPLYLKYGYVPAPFTIFKDTYKLKPGHYLCFKENNPEQIKYWDIVDSYLKGPLKKSEDEIEEELEDLLIDSFRYSLVSDVPVGIFLSGGIDSTTLTAFLSKNVDNQLKTFSIGFHENSYNEAEWAKKIANYLGTDHTEYYLSAKEAFEIVGKLPEIYDEPFADNSGIPTYLLSNLTRNNVKVALSADGGDELFCGYTRYINLNKLNSLICRLPEFVTSSLIKGFDLINPAVIENLYRNFKFALPDIANSRDKYDKARHVLREIKNGELADMYKTAVSIWMSQDLMEVMRHKGSVDGCTYFDKTFHELESRNLLEKMRATDFKTYLTDDILTKVDRATMSVGLEGRVPFLDHRLVEYSARIPVSLLYKNNQSKYVLRKLLYKHVPPKFLERPKQGFSIPLHNWLKKDMSELLKHYLSVDKLTKDNIFNPHAVDRLIKDYMKGSSININKLWSILMFEMWKERWLDI